MNSEKKGKEYGTTMTLIVSEEVEILGFLEL